MSVITPGKAIINTSCLLPVLRPNSPQVPQHITVSRRCNFLSGRCQHLNSNTSVFWSRRYCKHSGILSSHSILMHMLQCILITFHHRYSRDSIGYVRLCDSQHGSAHDQSAHGHVKLNPALYHCIIFITIAIRDLVYMCCKYLAWSKNLLI